MTMFQLELEYEVKHAFFFKGTSKADKDTDTEMDEDDFINKTKNCMKKNYVLVTIKDDVVIKNLGINKKSISPLAKKIFWDNLTPEIKKGTIKFSKTYVKNLINELLDKDISLASMRKEVGPYEQYADKSPNCMSAQIAKHYGSGIHFMIPNSKMIGVGKGKGKRFCTIEEFKQHNMKVEDIDLENVWKELDYFVKPVITKNIFDF